MIYFGVRAYRACSSIGYGGEGLGKTKEFFLVISLKVVITQMKNDGGGTDLLKGLEKIVCILIAYCSGRIMTPLKMSTS